MHIWTERCQGFTRTAKTWWVHNLEFQVPASLLWPSLPPSTSITIIAAIHTSTSITIIAAIHTLFQMFTRSQEKDREGNLVIPNKINESVIFQFLIGVEGAGHHLHRSLYVSSPAKQMLAHYDIEEDIDYLSMALWDKRNRSNGIWSAPCSSAQNNGDKWWKDESILADSHKLFAQLVLSLKNIQKKVVQVQGDNSRLHQMPRPLFIPINSGAAGNRKFTRPHLAPMMSYPMGVGPWYVLCLKTRISPTILFGFSYLQSFSLLQSTPSIPKYWHSLPSMWQRSSSMQSFCHTSRSLPDSSFNINESSLCFPPGATHYATDHAANHFKSNAYPPWSASVLLGVWCRDSIPFGQPHGMDRPRRISTGIPKHIHFRSTNNWHWQSCHYTQPKSWDIHGHDGRRNQSHQGSMHLTTG